ncbi:Similar to ANK1: Ankyrin-1 (Homo sapiens) [Cotesia congregata]|uniref:Similar to ANK1: Ankyrin-1 (Homo sapiens) n=1 Tax=Cotesia congregata TaxID=51543 RepID=A0A8J2HNW3_COTCN|nr:Similar to ANK1: Ankyrin-1 (Homo sapiens) [Cotesia congregata]
MENYLDMSNAWPMPLYSEVADSNTNKVLPHQHKSVNSDDYNLCVQQTSLCHFIGTEQVQSVKILLNQGAAVNVTMSSPHYTGYTLLHYAVERSNAEIVELLLKNGAHVDASTVENRLKPIHIAVMRGNYDIIKYLLIYKAQIDATFDVAISKEYSCLHLAAQNNDLNVIKLLLESGADINLQDKEKRTPLHLAIQAAQVEAVNLLLKYHPNTMLKNCQQQTPLIFALDNMCPVLFLRVNNIEDLVKLRLQHQYSGCKCEIITHTLVRHLIKLKVANFKIDEKDQEIILLSETYRELESSCSNELEQMQVLVVKNMTIQKLRDLQAVTHLELLSLFRGEPVIREPRSQTLKRDQDINNAWILYEQNILNIQSFLAYASFFLKPAYQEEEQNLNNMDIATDEEEDVLEVGGVILQPPEYYYAMEVFHEIDVVFE